MCSCATAAWSTAGLDVSGVDRTAIAQMKRTAVELWDVLVISTWASVQLTGEFYYAWSVVIAMCCICMHDRDLDVHEVFARLGAFEKKFLGSVTPRIIG